MCVCSLSRCQSALHSCTLLQWRVQTYALSVQLPMQVFLPPDISQPTFPEGHVSRELSEGLPVVDAAAAAWVLPWKKGDSFQLAMIWARIRSTALLYRLRRTSGPCVRELRMGEGECWGSGESVRVHLGM